MHDMHAENVAVSELTCDAHALSATARWWLVVSLLPRVMQFYEAVGRRRSGVPSQFLPCRCEECDHALTEPCYQVTRLRVPFHRFKLDAVVRGYLHTHPGVLFFPEHPVEVYMAFAACDIYIRRSVAHSLCDLARWRFIIQRRLECWMRDLYCSFKPIGTSGVLCKDVRCRCGVCFHGMASRGHPCPEVVHLRDSYLRRKMDMHVDRYMLHIAKDPSEVYKRTVEAHRRGCAL